MQSSTSTTNSNYGPVKKEKGKGILVEEPKKKKLTLQQIRALETAHDEEVARKVQAEWDTEEERKRLEDLKKPKPKTISKKPTSLTQERNQMMSFLKGQGYKNLQKLRLILLCDLTPLWEVSANNDDDFWKNQEDWEIIRWRLNESYGSTCIRVRGMYNAIIAGKKEDILYHEGADDQMLDQGIEV
ncbi:hypothetical protein Tco_1227302 [Tanacetum coccineum]